MKAARVLVMEDNLMIVDVRPGSGGGVRAADEILRGGSVPDVFVSGDISGLIAQRAEAVAIQKPLRVAELAQAIRRVLRAG